AKLDWLVATEAIGAVAFGAGQDPNKVHGEYVRQCIGPEYFELADIATTWDASELARSVTAPTLVIRERTLQFVLIWSGLVVAYYNPWNTDVLPLACRNRSADYQSMSWLALTGS